MDISDKVPQETKNVAKNLITECQVLQNLLNERKAHLQNIMVAVLRENTASPDLYQIHFENDKWEISLKAGVLMPVPPMNRADRRELLRN